MTDRPPRHPWWKRKRTWAALVWLIAAFFGARCVLWYADGREWVPRTVFDGIEAVVYEPIDQVLRWAGFDSFRSEWNLLCVGCKNDGIRAAAD